LCVPPHAAVATTPKTASTMEATCVRDRILQN
jgi:hypothetical protein